MIQDAKEQSKMPSRDASRASVIVDKSNKRLAMKICFHDFAQGSNFFTEEEELLQVGTWNYEKDKHLLAHIHNPTVRDTTKTQEFIFVLKGRVKAFIYDEEENFVEEVSVEANEGLLLLAGGHGYEIGEDGTKVIELKNGPYFGAEKDRRHIEN